jgi:DNA-binding NtrC family response regulator
LLGTSVAFSRCGEGFSVATEDSPAVTTIASVPTSVEPISLDDRLREFEASLIAWALAMSGGNKSKAAALLQVKRSTLGDRIARCGIRVERKLAAPDSSQ